MSDINATIPSIESFANIVQYFVGWIQWFVGGLFGLYLIYFISQVYRRQQEIKLLKDIKEELKHLHKVLLRMEKKAK